MLLTGDGHLRLTDFGLSKVSIHRDLEIEDLMKGSPNVFSTRTPGQLLSLTSHLTFGSSEKLNSSYMVTGSELPEIVSEINNESGILPIHNHSECMETDNVGAEINLEDSTYYSCKSCGQPDESCLCMKDASFPSPGLDIRLRSVRERNRKRKISGNEENISSHTAHRFLSFLSDISNEGTPNRYFEREVHSELLANATPLKSLLKHRNQLRDDQLAAQSTPVAASSGLHQTDDKTKIKRTRFLLAASSTLTELSKTKLGAEMNISPIPTPYKNAYNTPYKTPKNVRKSTICGSSDDRIIGTPDYLAPELLMKQQTHGPESDWWSLGVCLYEFMTGVPPFADLDVQATFNNIMKRVIEWPEDEEALSVEAVHVIDSLLTMEPQLRANGDTLRTMPLFKDIDWDKLHDSPAPFIPQPDSCMDTSYFYARNMLHNLKISEFNL